MCPLQLLEADGAEEEDDVEHKEAESQSAVQPPAVQMDTQDLGGGGRQQERALHFLLHCHQYNLIFLSESEAVRLLQGEDKMKITGKEKQATDAGLTPNSRTETVNIYSQ